MGDEDDYIDDLEEFEDEEPAPKPPLDKDLEKHLDDLMDEFDEL